METNYLETIKMMASIGLDWSVLPVSLFSGEIVKMDIEGVEIERLLGVVSHQHRVPPNAARMLMTELKGHRAELIIRPELELVLNLNQNVVSKTVILTDAKFFLK